MKQKHPPSKVLFISPFFFPEAISTGKYNTALARALVERGVELEVVTSHPLYPDWRPLHTDAVLHGMTIRRGGATVHYPKSLFLRRIVLEVWFTIYAARQVWSLRRAVSLSVIVSPPSLVAMALQCMLPCSVPSVIIVHDLQALLARRGGRVRRWNSYLIRAVERCVFRGAHRIVALSHAMQKAIACEYKVDVSRIHVCYPPATTTSRDEIGSNLRHLFPTGSKHVVYSGALGEKQNPMTLLEFFQKASEVFADTDFHIFSGGPWFNKMRNACSGHPRIHFHDLVSEADLPELYSRSDTQVVPQAENSSAAVLPSKLPNLVATGCVIFGICDAGSEVAQIVRDAACGVCVHSWRMDELINGLRTLRQNQVQESRADRQRRLRKYVLEQFNMSQLVDVVLGVAEEHSKAAQGQLVEQRDAAWAGK